MDGVVGPDEAEKLAPMKPAIVIPRPARNVMAVVEFLSMNHTGTSEPQAQADL